MHSLRFFSSLFGSSVVLRTVGSRWGFGGLKTPIMVLFIVFEFERLKVPCGWNNIISILNCNCRSLRPEQLRVFVDMLIDRGLLITTRKGKGRARIDYTLTASGVRCVHDVERLLRSSVLNGFPGVDSPAPKKDIKPRKKPEVSRIDAVLRGVVG